MRDLVSRRSCLLPHPLVPPFFVLVSALSNRPLVFLSPSCPPASSLFCPHTHTSPYRSTGRRRPPAHCGYSHDHRPHRWCAVKEQDPTTTETTNTRCVLLSFRIFLRQLCRPFFCAGEGAFRFSFSSVRSLLVFAFLLPSRPRIFFPFIFWSFLHLTSPAVSPAVFGLCLFASCATRSFRLVRHVVRMASSEESRPRRRWRGRGMSFAGRVAFARTSGVNFSILRFADPRFPCAFRARTACASRAPSSSAPSSSWCLSVCFDVSSAASRSDVFDGV